MEEDMITLPLEIKEDSLIKLVAAAAMQLIICIDKVSKMLLFCFAIPIRWHSARCRCLPNCS